MSEFEAILRYLFSLHAQPRSATNMQKLRLQAEALGSPHKKYPVVLVAGTNGKGSVTTQVSAGLHASNLTVGVYTSPHLIHFCERIKIGPNPIPIDDFCNLFHVVATMLQTRGERANFFEFVTLIAFCYFAQQAVDIAVIEVGIGGRSDATNIVDPILSIITSISYDHQELLGETLEAIAYEKAGILRTHGYAILGPRALYDVTTTVCRYETVIGNQDYELENTAISNAALTYLSNRYQAITPAIRAAAIEVKPRARFERKGKFILDVAHNQDGIEKLAYKLQGFLPYIALIGIGKNKDPSLLLPICSNAAAVWVVNEIHPRLLHPETIIAWCVSNKLPVAVFETFDAVVSAAHEQTATIVACGSFFLFPGLLEALGDAVDPVTRHGLAQTSLEDLALLESLHFQQ